MSEKYLIHCPKCKSTFNISEIADKWKQEFLELFDEAVKKFKEKK